MDDPADRRTEGVDADSERLERYAELAVRFGTNLQEGQTLFLTCEVASAEVGGDKAGWIRDMHAELRGRFADVRGVVWFDVDKETDWRVASSTASLAAFRTLAADRALS